MLEEKDLHPHDPKNHNPQETQPETTGFSDEIEVAANTAKEQIDDLKVKLSSKEEELSETKDSLMRAYAEVENVKRRAHKDVLDARKYSLEKFTDELLPVLDSMEKAVESTLDIKDVSSIIEGVELTMKMLISKMGKFGIKQINPEGKVFDPSKHEAMSMEAHSDFDDNKVSKVLQKGYELNSRVVRPARVVVVKNIQQGKLDN